MHRITDWARLLGVSSILVLGLLLPFASAFGVTNIRYVDDTGGVDTGDCTTQGSPCLTIAYAVSQADPGDTIDVAEGTYDENDTVIFLDESLTIRGPNVGISPNTGTRGAEAVLTSAGSGSPSVQFWIQGGATTDVTFVGLTFDTNTAPMRDDSSATVTLRENIFTATGGANDAMYFEDPILTIDDNLFTDIDTPNSDSIQIGSHYPVSSNTISITDNVWNNITSGGALNLNGVTGDIDGNTFNDVEYYGMLVASAGLYASGDLDITHNTFDGITNPTVGPVGNELTWGAGIRFYESDAATGPVNITGNFFANSYLGVSVRATDSDITDAEITVSDNSFIGNDADVLNASVGTLDASSNWWGTNTPAEVASQVGAGVDFTPWLHEGTDTSVDLGFQGDFSYLHVDDDSPQVGTVGRVQEGVDLVDANGIVDAAAGTYDEQVVVDFKTVTIQGAGNTTVIQPSSAAVLTSVYTTGTQAGAFFNATAIASVIDVHNSADVIIRDLKVDAENITSVPVGATWVAGIVFGETSGLIENVTVEDTKFVTPASTRTYGIWIDAVGDTALAVDVDGSTVQQYGRNGINGRGDDLIVDITDNTITGPGTVGPAQVPNGVLLISGATGTVTGNTITANHYTGAEFLGSGILLFQAGDEILVSDNDVSDVDDAVLINATDLAMVTDNDLSGNAKGVRIEAGSAANNTFTGNTIDNNSLFGIELSDTVGTGNVAFRNSIAGNPSGVTNASTNAFDAECNWWGAADGPSGQGAGSGDSVSANVDFVPWLGSAVLTSVCSGVPACVTAPFTDVPVSHPFCREIQWIKDEGISTGFGDGSYKPSNDINRAAMAAFMSRLADATLTPCVTAPFTDVPTSHPFCPEIQWVKDEGISTGFGDGSYKPATDITRGAMAAFMARLADATPTPCVTPPFTDVPPSHPFCAEIKWVKDNGISTGFGDGSYQPATDITRGAMAAFMLRVSSLLP